MGLKSSTADPSHKEFYCEKLWRAWKLSTKEDWYPTKFGPHPKLQFLMGLKSAQCWPESERTLSSLMFWWGILRKSSIRTTCNLPLQVVKPLNQSIKVWAPSKITILTAHTLNKSWARELQRDGPGRIWARDHLLPKLLQNAPGARELGGFKWKIAVLDSDLPLPLLKQE